MIDCLSAFTAALSRRASTAIDPHAIRAGYRVLALALAGLFALAAPCQAGTLVSMNFKDFGSLQIDLFDTVAPVSVDNFLHYINTGRYTNTIVHRKATFDPSGFAVIQGGGFHTDFSDVATFNQIVNEHKLDNVVGTIAMARSQDANSATSQWFINTGDNTVNGNQEAGYAVFGWVVNGGMTAVNSIFALPKFVFDAPFGELPLRNYTTADYNNNVDPTTHTVAINSVTIVTQQHPSFQNPILAADVNNDGVVIPADLNLINNEMLHNGVHAANLFVGSKYLYWDPNGDGVITHVDRLKVINYLLHHPISGSLSAAPAKSFAPLGSFAPMGMVPEPSTWVLAAVGIAAFVGLAARRRARSRSAIS